MLADSDDFPVAEAMVLFVNFILFIIGTVAFAITLHLGKEHGILELENTKADKRVNNMDIEMEAFKKN